MLLIFKLTHHQISAGLMAARSMETTVAFGAVTRLAAAALAVGMIPLNQ